MEGNPLIQCDVVFLPKNPFPRMEPPSLSLACHSSSLFLDQGKIESK